MVIHDSLFRRGDFLGRKGSIRIIWSFDVNDLTTYLTYTLPFTLILYLYMENWKLTIDH